MSDIAITELLVDEIIRQRDEARAQVAVLEARLARVAEIVADHWINLANSTDRFLATNYGLVVTVDDLNAALEVDQ